MKRRLFWLVLGVIYTIWPIDLIPDVAPGIGWIDDGIVDLICAVMMARGRKKNA